MGALFALISTLENRKNQMKSLKLITLLMGSTIALSACSSGDNAVLGSRDDIIIMKNGVPVSGNVLADVAMTKPTPTVDMMKPVVEVDADAVQAEVTEAVKQEVEQVMTDTAQEAVEDIAAESVVEAVPEKAKDAVTEVVTQETVEPVADAVDIVTEDVTETVAEVVETITPMKTIPMKAVKSVNAELMQKSAPMGGTPMKTEIVTEVEVAVVEELISEPIEPAKVEGGCYKKVLIPTVLDENKKVVKTPYVEDRRVICQSKMTSSLVAIVQQALISRDYNVGDADGKIGNKTLSAIESYQRKNGLGIGGFTYEMLEHLSIKVD
jgi:hypothetical protein